MAFLELLSLALIVLGCGFFFAGTVGVLRFPDLFTVLHALSKSDNLGLGFVILGLLLGVETWSDALKLVLIWLLAMGSGSTISHLIARHALRTGERPWKV